jgi:formate dehydrogenase subunit gamma
MTTPNHWDIDRATAVIDEMRGLPGALLPMLHALQEEFGYIHGEATPLLAETLNISKAEVVGVINFYADFRQEPPGRHLLKICLAESCQSMGSDALVARLRDRLQAAPGETSPDGAVTIEPVYCLGNCGLSPAVMLDGRLHGRVTGARAEALLSEALL